MRLLLIFLAGICACSAAVIPNQDESILLNAIFNASSNKNDQPKSLERPIWSIFKSIFLHSIQKEGIGNTGGKHTSNQATAVSQNSLHKDHDEWLDKKENPKNVISSETLTETRMTKTEHQNSSMNDSFNNSENEQEIVHKDMNIEKTTVMPNVSFSENILEMNKRNNSNISALIFTDYVTDFQEFSEDLNSIEFLSVNENDLMSEGSEIALFQELPTTGFEFLIDSETTKNLILTQFLTSQSYADLEESMAFDPPIPTKYNLDENDIGFNITPTEELFNLTKDWYILPEAIEDKNDTINLNVTGGDKSGWNTNAEFTNLLERSSPSHSGTFPVSLNGNTEAELNKSKFSELRNFDALPEVESESKNFISNTSDFEYDESIKSPTDLRNFVEEISLPKTTLLNAEFDKATEELETFNLVNNSQGLFGRENVESGIFNVNATNATGEIITSNDFADLNESLVSIPITREVGVDENKNEELNIKVPRRESFNRIDSHTLLGAEEKKTEMLQTNTTDLDYEWTSSKMELTLNSTQFTHSLDENEEAKLNLTQEILDLTDSDTLYEGTKTKFLSNSNNYANESTGIGEFLGLEEETRDFIPDTQSFKLDKSGEAAMNLAVSSQETLSMANNSEVFYEAEVAKSFNVNTTDIGNVITELQESTDFEEYVAVITKNHSFNLDENGDPELNMTSMEETFEVKKDFDVFPEQNETEAESFSLNTTDFLQGGTILPVEDTMGKTSKCPTPGSCLLWFFARDSCTEDDQCHSTQKCCKSGCSKICMDV